MKSFSLKRLVLFVGILVCHTSCQNLKSPSKDMTKNRGLASATGELGRVSTDEFRKFPRVLGATVIKFVAAVNASGQVTKIELIDPRVFQFHHQYLAARSEFSGWSYQQFQQISFTPKNRRFLFGILTAKSLDFGEGNWQNWVRVSFNSQDAISPKNFLTVSRLAKKWWKENTDENDGGGSDDEGSSDDMTAFEMATRSYVYEPTFEQEEQARGLLGEYAQNRIEVRFRQDSGQNVVYTQGWGVGRISLVSSEEDLKSKIAAGQIGPESLLILNAAVNELPPVAGMIMNVPLTEASHLVLLAQMYGIPLVYEKNSFQNRASSQGNWGFLVSEKGSESSYGLVDELEPAEVQELRSYRVQKKLKIQVDWTAKEILETASLRPDQVGAYGGKSTKFGMLRRLIPANTRSVAYALPLSYYKQYISTATYQGMTLEAFIQKTLSSLGSNPTYIAVEQNMAVLREAFKKSQIPVSFFENLRTDLQTKFPGSAKRLKLRSSSNVEDGAEFNGAGLYESEGVCLSGCTKDDFAKGFVKVWGSLFTVRGFWARHQFGVDESLVGMGILIHEPYKGELANGVAKIQIVRGEDSGLSDFEVMGVLGEDESVTNPNEKGGNEYVKMSDGKISQHRPLKGFPVGRLMMEQQHYKNLNQLMLKVAQQWPGTSRVIEIESEWKLILQNGQETVHVKQVREVPQVSPVQVPNAQLKIFTGGKIKFTGGWPEADVPWALKYRFLDLQMEMKSFTDQDVANNKLRFGDLTAKTLSGEFRFKFKSVSGPDVSEYGTGYSIAYTHPEFEDLTVSFYLSKNRPQTPLLTAYSSPISIFVNSLQKGDRDSARFSLRPPPERDVVSMQDVRPHKCLPPSQQGNSACPIKITCQSEKRWLVSDLELRAFDHSTISGLGAKPVIIRGFPNALYSYKQHEGIPGYFFDLSKIENLTPSEKNEILTRFGHYLSISRDRTEFLDQNMRTKRVIPECSTGDGDDGAEG